jgi:hypothetical protein
MPGDALFMVMMESDPAVEDDFDDWYSTEHLPAMAGTPGVLRVRYFKLHAEPEMRTADPPTYLALYDLVSRAVQASAEGERRRDTPWSHRIRRFRTRTERYVYERISASIRGATGAG